jgi:hypothetical protein
MTVKQQIKEYLASQDEAKGRDMQALHKLILKVWPKCKLWFELGVDKTGKVVSNPNIGYGSYTITYANGSTRDFFRIGLSANTGGISLYLMGIADKKYLINTYSKTLGKASVTGYCIKFKKLSDINLDVLEAAIRYASEYV